MGLALAARDWQVRGTSRRTDGVAEIEAAGIEARLADPAAVGTVLELIDDVAVLVWALGSARGSAEQLDALHGPRFERLLEHVVDTPVRGVVYEASGTAGAARLAQGAGVAKAAAERWRIRVELLRASPASPNEWTGAALAAVERALLGD